MENLISKTRTIRQKQMHKDQLKVNSELDFGLSFRRHARLGGTIWDKIKFIAQDYFIYTKNSFFNPITKRVDFLITFGYRQNKVLKDQFIYSEVRTKLRKMRQILLFFGIEQPSKEHRQNLYANTTMSFFNHGIHKMKEGMGLISKKTACPNLKHGFQVSGPEQLWVAEITSVSTKEGRRYFYLIVDEYSKQVVGYSISRKLLASSAIKALKMAVGSRKYYNRLIHHSKKGVHYCLFEYKRILLESKIELSASEY